MSLATSNRSPPRKRRRLRRAQRGPRWANRLAIFITLLLVGGPLGSIFTQMEVGAWHAAQGLEASWQNEFSTAIAKYDEALAWDPEETDYLVLRSEANLARGDKAQALADAKLALEIAPLNFSAGEAYAAALMHLGRATDVAEFYEERLKALGNSYEGAIASRRNQLAYALAFAGKDLDRALDLVNQAIRYYDRELDEIVAYPKHNDRYPLTMNKAATTDTRAMVLLRQSKLADALKDMDNVIGVAQILQERVEREAISNSMDNQHRKRSLHDARRTLATYYYHRSLIHAAIAEHEQNESARFEHDLQATLDRQRVRELGWTPDDSLF
jgi:tetratricopeptide (TPR) repeat protein